MMQVPFQKYHGTGNDFIIIDNTRALFPVHTRERKKLIHHMCDRNMGIGADGLILIEPAQDADFSMLYFNSDGLPGSFCGNGSRCAVAFAFENKIIYKQETRFEASDGKHNARINKCVKNLCQVEVELRETESPVIINDDTFFLDTGSPHIVLFKEAVDEINVLEEGRKIRQSDQWKPSGANVNFVEILSDGKLYVRTYERGVENETLSCGSGVTAAAMAANYRSKSTNSEYVVLTRGGELNVRFAPPGQKGSQYEDVTLEGPATRVFHGEFPVF